jgi:hypothetical protein
MTAMCSCIKVVYKKNWFPTLKKNCLQGFKFVYQTATFLSSYSKKTLSTGFKISLPNSHFSVMGIAQNINIISLRDATSEIANLLRYIRIMNNIEYSNI